VQIQTCIFIPKHPPSASLFRIHLELIIQSIDQYGEEIIFAIEEGKLHHTFLPQHFLEDKEARFERLFEELQNLINEDQTTQNTASDDDSSDDIEWL